jgi:hypothetical protein
MVHAVKVMSYGLKEPIHDQSCCAKLFYATQVCPFTIKSISTIHDQSCCTTRNVAQHDWSCMGPFKLPFPSRCKERKQGIVFLSEPIMKMVTFRVGNILYVHLQIPCSNYITSLHLGLSVVYKEQYPPPPPLIYENIYRWVEGSEITQILLAKATNCEVE